MDALKILDEYVCQIGTNAAHQQLRSTTQFTPNLDVNDLQVANSVTSASPALTMVLLL